MVKSHELLEKITQGLDLTFKRLLATKQKEDGEFIFSENGKIIRVKARDYKQKGRE